MSEMIRWERKSTEEVDEFLERPSRIRSLPMKLVNQARIGLFGVGAVGTTMIPLLVNSGIMHLVTVDMDHLERSNFSKTGMVYNLEEDCGQPKALMAAKRAQAAMLAGGEAYGVNANLYELGEDFVRQFDYVVSCVDDVELRKYLNDLCRLAGVPFFETGTNGLIAESQCYDHTAGCYACNAPAKAERVSCAVRYKEDVEDGHVPSCQLASTMSATLCVYDLLKAICGDTSVYNKQHYYDGNTGVLYNFPMNQSEDCPCCLEADLSPEHELPGDGKHMTRREFQTAVDAILPGTNDICWPSAFVAYDYCPVCGTKKAVMAPARRVKRDVLFCPDCLGKEEKHYGLGTGAVQYDMFDEPEEAVKDMTMYDLGYPLGSAVSVWNREEEQMHRFYLRDDMKQVLPEPFLRGPGRK